MIYHTVGFVCKVLICVNYVRCHGLADFNSAVTLNLCYTSAIATNVMDSCLVIHFNFAAVPQDLKGPSALISSL